MSKVATVMPEIGFDEEPISPVMRDETVTKKNPNSKIKTAVAKLISSTGASQIAAIKARQPPKTSAIGRSRCVRLTATVVTGVEPREARSVDSPPVKAPIIVGTERPNAMKPDVATAPAPM